MTTEERWRNPTKELLEFEAALGLGPKSLELVEWPDELVYDAPNFQTEKLNLPADPTQRKSQLEVLNQLFQNLKEKYGPALTLRLKLGTEELAIHNRFTISDIESFCEKVAGSPFDVYLRIRKTEALVTYWNLGDAEVVSKVFLFPSALERALNVSLPKLEGERGLMRGWTGAQKLMILVPAHTGLELNGDYLTILSGDRIERRAIYLPTTKPEEALEKVNAIRNQLVEKPRWTKIDLQYLTPLHLSVSWPSADDLPKGDDSIAVGVFSQLLVCSLLYVASTARSGSVNTTTANPKDYPWTLVFSAEKYSAKIEIQSVDAVRQAMTSTDGVTPLDASRKVGNLARWVFRDERSTIHRSALIQLVIASSLQDNEPAANLNELVRRADELTERVWHRWDDFLADKLGKYFLQLKQVEDAVATTTNNHKEQIQSLTKTLIDNTLAAVGVVVGSFIAAVFKSPFEKYIFWIGTGVYLAYLVAFPIVVGLITAWERFRDSQNSFSKTEKEFAGRLSEKEVQHIVGTAVQDSEHRFQNWFSFTTASYVTVVLLIVFAMWKLPNMIRNWSDSFEIHALDYGRSQPPSSDLAPLIIRGANFDKDKEIVVRIGNSTFTNADGETLKVVGSHVLTLTPRHENLTAARTTGNRAVSVTQGAAGAKTLLLPADSAPIPKPTVDKWVDLNPGVEAWGSNLGSILEISYEGKKLDVAPAADLKKLVITEAISSNQPWHGRTLAVKLKNGETFSLTIDLTANKPPTAAKRKQSSRPSHR